MKRREAEGVRSFKRLGIAWGWESSTKARLGIAPGLANFVPPLVFHSFSPALAVSPHTPILLSYISISYIDFFRVFIAAGTVYASSAAL